MTAKREYDRLIGVWRHPASGWEIKYQRDGKKHSEYRQDEREARLRADYWRATLEGRDGGDHGDAVDEHIVYYWDRKLRQIAELLLSDPCNREIAATCRSIASAAQAAMRAAKYVPAPSSTSPDSPSGPVDVTAMSSEEMKALLDG